MMTNRAPRPPPLRTRVLRGNEFTMQQAGSDNQFQWFNHHVRPENTVYGNHRMPMGLLNRQMNRQIPFSSPISPSMYRPITPITPPTSIISPPLPASVIQQPDDPMPMPLTVPSSPMIGSTPSPRPSGVNMRPTNDRSPEIVMNLNDELAAAMPHAQLMGITPLCPYSAYVRNRPDYPTNQTVYYNPYQQQTNNTNYVRPAYAPHESLWYQQQNNQEMHRRHMIHPANLEGMSSANPQLHHDNTHVQMHASNSPNSAAHCVTCDIQQPGNNRRMRSYAAPSPAVRSNTFSTAPIKTKYPFIFAQENQPLARTTLVFDRPRWHLFRNPEHHHRMYHYPTSPVPGQSQVHLSIGVSISSLD